MQDKSTISKIVYIVLVAVLALAAVFGYDIGVIQPREAATQTATAVRAAGVNVRTEKALVVDNYITDNGTLAVAGAATVGGTLDVTGAVTTADLAPSSLAVAGGFNSTGCTLSATGTLKCDGAATIGGAATVTGTITGLGSEAISNNLTVGGGFNDTGCTLSTAGNASCDGILTVGGASTFSGTLTAIGTAAVDNLTIGGGQGSNGCTGTTAGAWSCDGALVLGTSANVGTSLVVGTWDRIAKQGVITVTDGMTIAPTGSYQPLTSAASVGTSAITAGMAGYLLTLVNVGGYTITLTDTSTLILSGNIALGQYDVLRLQSDGTNWLQASPVSDN